MPSLNNETDFFECRVNRLEKTVFGSDRYSVCSSQRTKTSLSSFSSCRFMTFEVSVFVSGVKCFDTWQSAVSKFYFKPRENATEMCQELKNVCGNDFLSRAQVLR